MIDAGNNALVTWADPLDLRGYARIIDGDGDGTAMADLGAYEHDPNAPVPVFKTPAPSYVLYKGASLTIPVTIEPVAGGAVEADVSYGESPDVSGPATLSLPNGAGPVDLVVTAAAELTNPGTSVAVSIAESTTSLGVDSGDIELKLRERRVKVAGSGRVFVVQGEWAEFRISLLDAGAAAPADIHVAVGSAGGTGTNAIAWSGDAVILAGASTSAGALQVTGGLGVNTIELTVDSGFAFVESGAAAFVLEIQGVPIPVYVSGTGEHRRCSAALSPTMATAPRPPRGPPTSPPKAP